MTAKHKKVLFDVNDEVVFQSESIGMKVGLIVKLNPKNAVVDCGDSAWNVPYQILEHISHAVTDKRAPRITRILEVDKEARQLMNHHGLKDWQIEFNDSIRQLGACKYHKKRIVLSRFMALNKSPEQATDVILHEIAHALAGWEAGHGPKWKSIASQIGARPRSCAPASPEISGVSESVKETIKVGDTVTFVDKNGQCHEGSVLRKNPKTARVMSRKAIWRVPYRMLKIV